MTRRSSTCRSLGLLPVLVIAAGCVTGEVLVSGLRPLCPEAVKLGSEVASSRPMLRWETFPRPEDLKADKKGLLQRAEKVTYDVRIWRLEDNRPVERVYARDGLPKPAHKVGTPLEPSTKYLWTVRARFELDGQPRVSEWGVMLVRRIVSYRAGGGAGRWIAAEDFRRLPQVPNPSHYRFKTPKKGPVTDESDAGDCEAKTVSRASHNDTWF